MPKQLDPTYVHLTRTWVIFWRALGCLLWRPRLLQAKICAMALFVRPDNSLPANAATAFDNVYGDFAT